MKLFYLKNQAFSTVMLVGKLSTVFENDASEYDAGGAGWQVGGFQTDDIQVGIVSGKSGDWKNQRGLCVV